MPLFSYFLFFLKTPEFSTLHITLKYTIPNKHLFRKKTYDYKIVTFYNLKAEGFISTESAAPTPLNQVA